MAAWEPLTAVYSAVAPAALSESTGIGFATLVFRKIMLPICTGSVATKVNQRVKSVEGRGEFLVKEKLEAWLSLGQRGRLSKMVRDDWRLAWAIKGRPN